MKYGIISDLHLDLRGETERRILLEKLVELSNQVDIILDAGDLHPNPKTRELVIKAVNCPYLIALGNHDYYQQPLSTNNWTVGNIAGGTLWTNFYNNDIYCKLLYRHFLDYHRIIDASADAILAEHNKTLAHIAAAKPEIVVTHHAPSYKSCHEKYKDDPNNDFFVSDLEQFILDNPNIKYWIHGHTHTDFNYRIGECQVICNPLGYRFERAVKDYHPVIIQV
jgi:predicted phosphodiesterase